LTSIIESIYLDGHGDYSKTTGGNRMKNIVVLLFCVFMSMSLVSVSGEANQTIDNIEMQVYNEDVHEMTSDLSSIEVSLKSELVQEDVVVSDRGIRPLYCTQAYDNYLISNESESHGGEFYAKEKYNYNNGGFLTDDSSIIVDQLKDILLCDSSLF